jgi:acetyltransferase-like isoleucine patch superfamily enzyme
LGKDVFIGDDVYLENEYPECVEIGDATEVGLRTVIIAHLRGPGRVVVGKNVWIGACCLIASANGRTVRIGDGAVIAAGSVITADVSERALIKAPLAVAAAVADIPLATSTYQQFLRGLRPIRGNESAPRNRQ